MIKEYLDQIISARYGKDVRQAIHDGIKEIDGVARTAQDSATTASQTAMEKASQAVSASETAIQKAEEAQASSEQAKKYADNASAVTGVEIATKDRAGLVKGGDNYIAEDGTLTLAMETTEKVLENSFPGGIKVENIGGASEQAQYTGKNLYSCGDQTFTKNVDVTLEKELQPGTYTISAFVTSTDTDQATSLIGFIGGGEGGGNVNKQLERDKRNSVVVTLANAVSQIRFNASGTLANSEGDTATWKDIQIEAGENMTDFEPYTGNKQSPSPEYPQERKKVILSGAKSVNKNLFNPQTIVKGRLDNGVLDYESDTTDLTVSGDTITCTVKNAYRGFVSDYIAVNNSVAISCVSTGGLSAIDLFDKNKNFIRRIGFTNSTVLSLSDNEAYIRLNFQNTTTGTFTVSNIQVELSEKVTDYVPHQESSIKFTNPITLNGIGDAQDLIVRKDGVWSIERETTEEVLDSSTTWSYEFENLAIYKTLPLVKKVEFADNIAISDCLIYNGSKAGSMTDGTFKVGCTSSNLTKGLLYIKDSKFTSQEAVENFFSNRDINILYPLETPTFEPLPTADQIALNSLLSFDGTTHMYFDSEVECTSLVEYGTSRVGALTLEAWNKAENNRIRTEEMAATLQMINQG